MTAAEKILRKALVASKLDSREWNGIQAGLRDRAFFSSRVAKANILDALRQRTAEYADGHTSMSDIRQQMRKDLETMHYTPEKGTEGTIRDLYSKARLDVIVKQNVATARGFIRWAEGNSPGAYAAFPAQEFKRVHPRKNARGDWPQRWAKAGGKIYGGRMIALKDDPVWTKLSVFGNPYPPFDWGSGMGVRDIDRKTAIALGLIDDAGIRGKVQKLEERRERGDLPSMNGNLQATVPATQDVVSKMKADFGDLADVVKIDDRLNIKWRPEILRETVLQKKDFSVQCGVPQQGLLDKLMAEKRMEHFANQINGKQLVVDNGWRDTKRSLGGTHIRHFMPNPDFPDEIPLRPEDIEMIPSIWRNPTRVVKIDNHKFIAELDAFDGSTYLLQVMIAERSREIKKKIGAKEVRLTQKYQQPIVWTFFRTKMPTSKKISQP